MQADAELLTYDRGAFAAQIDARAFANAGAAVDLRRGVRADAHAEVGASLDANLAAHADGASAQAVLHAQLSAAGRAAFAVQLDVHGLFAEATAGVEARARIQADISVTGKALLSGLQEDLPPYLFRPAVALLEQTELHAGVFAEVYLALKAQARLQAGGSVIPIGDDARSGFTVGFQYGYGYIYGAGFHGYVDLEFPDAAAIVDAVVHEVLEQLDGLMPADAPPEVMMLLRLLLPLAGSAAVAVGRDLGAPQVSGEAAQPDLGRVATSFLREVSSQGLRLVLTTVLQAAGERAAAALLRAVDIPFDDRLRVVAQHVLDEAPRALAALQATDSPLDALPTVIEICGVLAELGDGTSSDPMGEVVDAMTVVGAGAAVLLSVLGRDPLPEFPASLAARINAQLHPQGIPEPGTPPQPEPPAPPVNLFVMSEYLGAVSDLLSPQALRTIEKVAQAVGRTPEDLIRWLWQLGSENPDAATAHQLASDVIDGLIDRLSAELTPFIEGLPAGDLKDLAAFVRPLLEIVELALPALIAAGPDLSAEQAARLRDQLDTELTQLFGALTVRILDRIVRPYFKRGADQLSELADRVDRSDPAFADFFALANRFEVLFRINETIVSAALRETAGILPLVESSGLDSAVKLLGSFVLLPEQDAERRAQLAALAGTDSARTGDGALRTQLLEAMIVDSLELAVGMVAPSVRMSTVIALEQGPVPLLTLWHDVEAVGAAMSATVADLQQAGRTAAQIIADLVSRGKVQAQQLEQLGRDLKALIHGLTDIADKALKLLKDLLWPVWVASTGGAGLLFPWVYDEFFKGATWINEQVRNALDQVVDAVVAATIQAAQNLGVLDNGSGGDLGQLGEVVRQRALGQPGETAVTVQIGPGQASVSRAELATLATNSAFDKAELRDRIREMHNRAVDQVRLATQADLLRSGQGERDRRLAELQRVQAAKSLPTGTPLRIRIEGLTDGQVVAQSHRFSVVLPEAHASLVWGASQVRIEVGATERRIDPRIWQRDGQGNVACEITVVCEAPAASTDSAGDMVRGIRDVEARIRAQAGPDAPPVMSIAGPSDGLSDDLGRTVRARDFLPWALTSTSLDPLPRPAVLAVDRLALMQHRAENVAELDLRELPGTDSHAFLASTELPAVAALLRPEALGVSVTDLLPPSPGRPGPPFPDPSPGPPSPPPGVPFTVVISLPPGFATVTACVCALPGPGQDQTSTPQAIASTWCVISPDPPAPLARVTPARLAFGEQRVGTSSAPLRVTVANAGTQPLTVTRATIDVGFHATVACPVPLPPGHSCAIDVAFRPGHDGPLTGTLRVHSNAPGAPATVGLVGTGLLEPVAAFDPPAIEFGSRTVGVTGPPLPVTIRSFGAIALSVQSATINGTNAADFTIVDNTCSGTAVRPEEACTLSVQFRPGDVGLRTAELVLRHDAITSPDIVNLTGTGVASPYAGFAQAAGRTLTISGYQVTIDGRALSHALLPLAMLGGMSELSNGTTHDLTLIPAAGYRFQAGAGIVADFGYDLTADGRIVVDARYAGFAQAAGRTLTISGYQITIDGRGLPHDLVPVSLLGDVSVMSRGTTHDLTLIPATAYVLRGHGGPEPATEYRFSLDTDGTISLLDVTGGLIIT